MVIISACLAGVHCKYNGGHNLNEKVLEFVSAGKAMLVCPEQLGGCTTPRPAVEISGGTGNDVLEGTSIVLNRNGEDVTKALIKGAEEVLNIARQVGAKKAILKSKSPSCGCGKIYDGSFSGQLREGNGVTAELLLKNGIEVITEEELG